MVTGNFKMAFDSIRSAKMRSFLTMLGIIIGVVSVVTIVSIGEGVKHQISGQISNLGPDLITIKPGKTVSRDSSGHISGVNFLTSFAGSALTENDLKVITDSPDVKTVVPLSFVTGAPRVDNKDFEQAYIFGTTDGLPEVLNQKVEYGEFFDKSEASKGVAIIGKNIAEDLFKETVPIGRSMQIRGETFIVRGVFEEFQSTSITPSADYNSAIFIPINKGKQLSNGQVNIQQVLAKPSDPDKTNSAVDGIQKRLLASHAGQNDFTILKQEDNLAIANTILNLLTGLISGVAAISLIVGGIGIMNIMLVSVTERTQEIGIRKAVGATNQQILAQFIIEAAMISFVGGLLGVLGSVFANFLIRIFTDLQPLVTFPIMIIAIGVALLVGVVFGVAPALKAARKDPIEALRQI